jgi:hypothetical protein
MPFVKKHQRVLQEGQTKLPVEGFSWSRTYWNGNGKYNAQNTVLFDRYISGESGSFKKTKNSSANKALNALRAINHKYYRLFNDGDRFSFRGLVIPRDYKQYSDEYQAKEFFIPLEKMVDEIILEAWYKTKEGTEKIIGEN